MTEPHVVEIGRLRVAGDRFEFTPAGEEFEVPRGRDVLLTLPYEFEEASPEREGFRLAFTVEVGRAVTGGEPVLVGDLPLVHDEARGALGRLLPAPTRSEEPGVYRIEASYRRGSWLTHEGDAVKEFREERPFRVRLARR